MDFVLKANHRPGKRVVKLLVGELDQALAALARQPLDDAAIHAVRRCGKRSRALLRLLHDVLPRKDYEREQRCWREAGRAMGDVRDAEVLDETVVRLRQHYASGLPAAAATAARQRFTRQKAFAMQAAQRHTTGLIAALGRARTRITQWRLVKVRSALWDGFARSYRTGRHAFRAACDHPNPDYRHAWRKRVKDLLYQTILLEPLCPGPLHAWKRAWDKLADCLGQEHDLQMLLERLDIKNGKHATRRLARLSKRWAARLQHDATELGDRLHSERTGALMKRLRCHARSSGRK